MDALAHYRDVYGQLPAGAPWLDTVRAGGLARLEASGFPGRKNEDWKYTNPARLLATPFAPADSGEAALPDRALIGSATLVFVDGRFSGPLSRLKQLPEGVVLRPLSAKKEDPLLGERVGAILGEASGFDALNTAFLTDGALVEIAPKADVTEPIHLVHLSTGGGRLNAVRVVVRAGRSSRATVIEHWLGTGPALTTAVTELDLDDNAELTHLRVQDEDPEAGQHVGTVVSRQARDARLHSWVVTLGAQISRVDLRIALAGEGAEVALHGLYLLKGSQHADHHTHVDHAVPHTNSREHYKGILDDRARGVFTGRVLVRKDAQKIDSTQTNNNLVLSEGAVANSRPQLEIFADDVKCAHGATIGRLDPDAMFYLQSRGLAALEAKRLLTFAFANEVLAGLPEGGVRTRLEGRVHSWLESR